MLEILTIIFIVALLIPITVYMSAKMGMFGILRGKELFDETHNQQGEEDDKA